MRPFNGMNTITTDSIRGAQSTTLNKGVPFINTSGEIIPPYAVMEVAEGGLSDLVVKVKKPTADSINPARLLFNGGLSIGAGSTSTHYAQQAENVIALLDQYSNLAIDGTETPLGTKTAQWYLTAGQEGFRPISGSKNDGTLGRCVRVRFFKVTEIVADPIAFSALHVTTVAQETSWQSMGVSIYAGDYRVRDIAPLINSYSIAVLTQNAGASSASLNAQWLLYVNLEFTNSTLVSANTTICNVESTVIAAYDYTANVFKIFSRHGIGNSITESTADPLWATLPLTHAKITAIPQKTLSPAPVGNLWFTVTPHANMTLGFTKY